MKRRRFLTGAMERAPGLVALPATEAHAASAAELTAEADATLALLPESEPVSSEMIEKAEAILIFPKIVKGRLVVGAASGKGVLRMGDETKGYFRSTALSYGLQAGIAKFGCVMFIMDDESREKVRDTKGWEVGLGPDVTIADEGFARTLSTTTAHEGLLCLLPRPAGLPRWQRDRGNEGLPHRGVSQRG